jgi:hypothetical protein
MPVGSWQTWMRVVRFGDPRQRASQGIWGYATEISLVDNGDVDNDLHQRFELLQSKQFAD